MTDFENILKSYISSPNQDDFEKINRIWEEIPSERMNSFLGSIFEIAILSKDQRLYYHLAVWLYFNERYNEAQLFCEKAVNINPNDESLKLSHLIAIKRADIQRSYKIIKRMEELNSSDETFLRALALHSKMLWNYEKTLDTCRDLLDIAQAPLSYQVILEICLWSGDSDLLAELMSRKGSYLISIISDNKIKKITRILNLKLLEILKLRSSEGVA